MRAVLDVVENRMRKYKQSACEAMVDYKQFSFYTPTNTYPVTNKMLTEYEKVRTIKRQVGKDVLFYHAASVKPYWLVDMKRVKRIKRHIFYRLKKRRR